MFRPCILASAALQVTVLALSATRGLVAQQPSSPAQGPWSGQAQCVVVSKSAEYLDEQTHTWRLTGAAPASMPVGSAQVYYSWPATWTVQGSGRKAFPSRVPGVPARDDQVERWTIASEMNATLRVTEIAGQTARIRIGAEGQRGAPLGSVRVTEVSGRTRDGAVQPWQFPAIEDSATNTTLSGTSTRRFPEGFGVGPGQPPKAVTTATCTWRFTRGGFERSSENLPARGRGARPTAMPQAPAPSVSTTAPAAATGQQAAAAPRAAAPAASSGTSPFAGTSGGAGVALGQLQSCTTPGPDTEPTVTPTSVRFAWRPVAGATGYVVTDGNGNPLTPAPITQLTYTHNAAHNYSSSYSYSVMALLANGGCARTNLRFTPPRPLTPQVNVNVTASTQPGRVTLTWSDQADVPAYYLVLGPGLPQNSAQVTASRTGQRYEIAGLPAGVHSWQVVPYWTTADEIVGDVSLGARVTATITLLAPRAIELTGFTATGTAVPIPPRTVQLTGFNATGTAVVIPPRTITISGWTSAGSAVQGVIR